MEQYEKRMVEFNGEHNSIKLVSMLVNSKVQNAFLTTNKKVVYTLQLQQAHYSQPVINCAHIWP